MIELSPEFKANYSHEVSFSGLLSQTGEIYRDVRGRKTLRFECAGKAYFIKIHYGVGWREIVKNLFQGKLPVLGAKNEYLAIKRLETLEINTMALAGYGCRGWNPAKLQSFVITEELSDTISLEDLCKDWLRLPPSVKLKRALIREVANIAKTLHENGINHRDLYICHFLLPNSDMLNPDTLKCYLIDLHRVQIRSKTPVRWKIKDISALYFSSMNIGLTRTDLLRFIKIYRDKPLYRIFKDESRFWGKVRKKAERLCAKSLKCKDPSLDKKKD